MFDHWAQPVTSKPWAIVCVILYRLKRMSGFRLFGKATGNAHRRAVGLKAVR